MIHGIAAQTVSERRVQQFLLALAEEARSRGRMALTPYHPVHPGRLAAIPDDGLVACREQ